MSLRDGAIGFTAEGGTLRGDQPAGIWAGTTPIADDAGFGHRQLSDGQIADSNWPMTIRNDADLPLHTFGRGHPGRQDHAA
jgi:hypothetical protein